MKARRVGVLMGGLSAEREVSIASGEAIQHALTDRGHDAERIYVERDIDQVLRQAQIDVAFIALRGSYGEDGCIQGLLELMGIPYTGSGVGESALAMDKLRSKEMFRLHNVPTPPYYTIDRAQLDRLPALHGSFGFPVVAKPQCQGSSIGVGRADNLEQLRLRVAEAARFDRGVLIERYVRGREIAVGVLDGGALGAIEIVPRRPLYDYRAKYQGGQSEYHFPARLSPARYQEALRVAERAATAVGAAGACRVDLLATAGGNLYALEVNTLPGMTPTSLLPKIAAGAGYDFADLCEAILERAALRHVGAIEAPLSERRGCAKVA